MIRVERMRPEHLDAVHAIEIDSFAIPWSKQELLRDLTENERACYFVALDDTDDTDDKDDSDDGHGADSSVVAGYAGMWHVVNEGQITNIAVDECHRRKGVASRLMEQMIAYAKENEMIGLTLEVRVGNRAAMGLYHKYGFKMEGYRKNYYADTKEDAVIMWKYF